jgi:hypothetical protein
VSERRTKVALSDAELVLLDGRCSAEAQTEIDAAKRRLAFAAAHADLSAADAGFVADVVNAAIANGRLTYSRAQLLSCSLCERVRTYAKRKRWSRKGAAGSPDYDRPIYVPGVDLAQGFVIVQGIARLGCCVDCLTRLRPVLATALADVRAQIPEGITGVPARFVRYGHRHCAECGWDGHEGEMRRERTVLGDGTYPAGCPKCDANNLFLGPTLVAARDGFTVVEAAA